MESAHCNNKSTGRGIEVKLHCSISKKHATHHVSKLLLDQREGAKKIIWVANHIVQPAVFWTIFDIAA